MGKGGGMMDLIMFIAILGGGWYIVTQTDIISSLTSGLKGGAADSSAGGGSCDCSQYATGGSSTVPSSTATGSSTDTAAGIAYADDVYEETYPYYFYDQYGQLAYAYATKKKKKKSSKKKSSKKKKSSSSTGGVTDTSGGATPDAGVTDTSGGTDCATQCAGASGGMATGPGSTSTASGTASGKKVKGKKASSGVAYADFVVAHPEGLLPHTQPHIPLFPVYDEFVDEDMMTVPGSRGYDSTGYKHLYPVYDDNKETLGFIYGDLMSRPMIRSQTLERYV